MAMEQKLAQVIFLYILCVRSIRCQFSTFEQCQEWLKRLNAVVRPPSRLEDLFSFAFHAWCMNVYAGEKEQHSELCRPGMSSFPSQTSADNRSLAHFGLLFDYIICR